MQTTDEFDSTGAPASGEVTAETHIAPLSISRERCSGCGATLASDQRYCVECGQRRGAPRLPFTEGFVDRARQAPGTRVRSGRARVSINNTVIAGIGTLLLAMGIGVLIGRAGDASNVRSPTPAVQVVTVPGAGAAGTAGTESQTSTGATGTTKSKGAASSTSAAKSAAQASKKAAVPPAKTVTVGSPGKGAGYEKGHFTGNFFGK